MIEHVHVPSKDTPPYCAQCQLPRRNQVHVPPKDDTIPLF